MCKPGRIPLVVYTGPKEALKGKCWIRQRVNEEVVRGFQRRGVIAGNLSKEAEFANDRSSPQVEVPQVIAENMRVESKTLSAQDIAVYWRLYAEARLHGLSKATHTIRIEELRKYLGIPCPMRVRRSIERLAAAQASYNFTGPRITLPMLEFVDIELGGRRGKDLVHFRLSKEVREAGLQSRSYAKVDINAFPRFKSKFTAPVYLRMCLHAGYNRAEWRSWTVSKAKLRDAMGMPNGTRDRVFQQATWMVESDITSLGGPRKRFDLTVLYPASDREDDTYDFIASKSLLRLRQAAPAELGDDMYEQVYDHAFLQLERRELSGVLRLRQATTLARQTLPGVSVMTVRNRWARDVNEAKWLPNPVAGMAPADFLKLVHEDIDYAIETWIDHVDFGVKVEVKTVAPPPVAENEPEERVIIDRGFALAEVSYYDSEHDPDADDIKLVEDYPEIHEVPYDGEEPPDFGAFDDGDDYDIAA